VRRIGFPVENELFIGDNVEIMPALFRRGFRFDAVYVDPPFPVDKRATYEDGKFKLLPKPGDPLGEWVHFIRPRLELAQGLLREKWVFFASIGAGEAGVLRKLLDEVLDGHFVSRVKLMRHPENLQGLEGMSDHDFLFVYSNVSLPDLDSVWDEPAISYRQGLRDAAKIFGAEIYHYPSSVAFIKKVLRIVPFGDFSVLDPFAGTGTTAQAVVELNREDGGSRRFVLIQKPAGFPEGSPARKAGYPTVADLCRERVRRISSTWSRSRAH
jgi:hypothetical protein